MRKIIFAWLFLAAAFGTMRGQTASQPEKQIGSPAKEAQRKELERLVGSVKKLAAASKYEESLPLARRSLEIADAHFADESNLVLVLALNLANLLYNLKDYNEAEIFYERSLPLAEEIYGSRDARLADILERLAQINYYDKRNSKTESYLLRVLEIRRAALGDKSETTVETIRDLAGFYAAKGEPKKAEPLYAEIVDLYEEIYGDEALDTKQAEEVYTCFLYSNPSLEEIRKEREKQRKEENENHLKGIINGKAVSLPKPTYPRGLNIAGVVLVRAKVDVEGRVYSAKSFCGPGALREISVAAAQKAKFKPTLMNGKPISVTGIIVYNYVR